jgi:hypothetical protein
MFEIPGYQRIYAGDRGDRHVAQVVSIASRNDPRLFIDCEKPSALEILRDQL